MNVKHIAFALITSVVAVSFAVETATDSAAEEAKRIKRLKRLGGQIQRPNTGLGKIAVVNAQKTVDFRAATGCVADLVEQTMLNIELQEASDVTPINVAEKLKATGAPIAVFLVENPKCSVRLLTAPEDGWALVNVAAIGADGVKGKFLESRVRKETLRAIMVASGAMNSQFPGSIMGSVRKSADFDTMTEDIPLDVIGRALETLEKVGVTPAQWTNYRKACNEGWAPAPTNEYQRAIWDQIKADKERGPVNGLKIVPPNQKKK